MIKSYRIRLEPNKLQNTKLFQNAGVSRFAYNWALARRKEHYKKENKTISIGDLRKEFTKTKKIDEYKWLNNYSNNITKQAIKDLGTAYDNFFGGECRFPKFKSRKKSQPKFYVDTEKIQFSKTHVKLEKLTTSRKKNKQKLNWIKLSEKDKIPFGKDIKYLNPRVKYDGVNWYISVSIEIIEEKEEIKSNDKSIGIDLGVKNLAVCSNIEKPFKNINRSPKAKKLEKRLRLLQRKVSRKYDMNKQGNQFIKTKNIIKLEQILRKIHIKLNNIRTNYRWQVINLIVKTKPSRIVMENLNVEGMLKNKHLSKAIREQCFDKFVRCMEHKCNEYGIEFVLADKWFPSSKMCSCCKNIKKDLKLKDRIYKCECGLMIDRDKNASVNLSRYKLA